MSALALLLLAPPPIRLVSNRSLLGELGGLSNNKQMSLANECSI
ncbi:hypothetical protein [Helicobacter pylori]|nr:hypothetical protein [Helicobacter pylori]